VIVIEHQRSCGLGRFGPWLAAAGLEPTVVRPYLGDPVPARADDGLIVLGGEASAWQDERCPWLPATRELIARSVADGVPTLGICLGAQLMTLACGGVVEPGGHGLEAGVVPVDPLPAAAGDPLLGHLSAGTPAVQFHYDVSVTLPPGAVLLATGAVYPNQAYRLGRAAWAVQFHPEATTEIFRGWLANDAGNLTARGLDIAALAAAVAEAQPRLVAARRPLAEGVAAVGRRERERVAR